MATTELDKLRFKAHKIAENIWGKWNDKSANKGAMYAWIKENCRQRHISQMDKKDVLHCILRLKERLLVKELRYAKARQNFRHTNSNKHRRLTKMH